jgi:hypothetical protein
MKIRPAKAPSRFANGLLGEVFGQADVAGEAGQAGDDARRLRSCGGDR